MKTASRHVQKRVQWRPILAQLEKPVVRAAANSRTVLILSLAALGFISTSRSVYAY